MPADDRRVLLGVDVGTSGTRALAVDADSGAVVAQATATYPLSTPHPGWSEQDPGDWVEAARTTLATVAREAGGEPVGLGLAGQMHGSVVLDGADDVIRPALLWNDQRTADACAQIEVAVGKEALLAATGNPALTGFQAPKLLWLREHEPDAYARVRSVLLPKDHVRLALTGEKATDLSDASGTLLLDVGARAWSSSVLEALELPADWLPRLHEGTEPAGALRPAVAEELGLPAGLPVAGGGGDNAAAAIGVGVGTEGRLVASIGTSGVLFAPTDGFAHDPSGRIHSFCHALPQTWHQMAVTLAAGASLTWWRETLGDADFDGLVDAAAGVAAGAEGLVFLPYLTGERTPHLDPDARGAFVGLTSRHGRAQLTRAVLEGVVFSLRDGLDVMRGLGLGATELRAVGGGARSATWRQILADGLGAPVRRPVVDEGPAYGAALLAGVAAGVYADAEEAMTRVQLRDEVTEPADSARYDELHAIYADLYGRLREPMHRLTALGRTAG